jgi:hypothetical protein
MDELDALALTHLGELKVCSLGTAVASVGKAAGWHGNHKGILKLLILRFAEPRTLMRPKKVSAQCPLRHWVRLVRATTMSNIMYIVLIKHTNIRISEHNINKRRSK